MRYIGCCLRYLTSITAITAAATTAAAAAADDDDDDDADEGRL